MNETDLQIGDKVVDIDQDEENSAIVIDIHDAPVIDVEIPELKKPVADFNRDYPEEDQVVEIAFESDLLDNFLGLAEKDAHMKTKQGEDFKEVFERNIRNFDGNTYYYPCSRLEQ